jgi:thioester reductase-like protein
MRSDSTVLVTGATGFIGREIVRRLLRDGRHVVALARARAGQSAVNRVRTAIGGVPSEGRLTVVAADLTRLDAAAWANVAWLRDNIATVIHCAGDTRFLVDDLAAFRGVHVNGPVSLLETLAGGCLRRFAHVSTAFVCGRRSGKVLEDDRDVGQTFHNPYEHAKLEAELQLVRAATTHGIDLRVLRPSIVVGSAPGTSGGVPSNLLFAIVRLLARVALRSRANRVLRVPGRPHAPFNIVLVEYVADAAIALTEHPDAAHGTFHLVMSEPMTQAMVLATVSDAIGLTGARVVDRRCIAADASPLERRLDSVLGPYREYLAQDVRFDDRRARAVLTQAGIPAATLDKEAIERLVGLAIGSESVAS